MKELVKMASPVHSLIINRRQQDRSDGNRRHYLSHTRLSVAPEDMGRVIGRNGRVANAMRTLLRVIAAKQGKRVTLEIV